MSGSATTTERAATDRAAQAARTAGVDIRFLDQLADLEAADRLLGQVWLEDQGAMSVHLLKALAHTQNYVAGAFSAGGLVGASVAFAWGVPDRRALHSHITGVRSSAQTAGVGYALKLHQWAWSRQHGVTEITWTFDPLVRRNAWFNLAKLGVRVTGYHADFYGRMHDGINAGDESDRCTVTWDIGGELQDPHPPTSAGAVPLLVEGPDGQPVVTDDALSGAPVSCRIPDDIVGLRRADPDLAAHWRRALRATMGRAVKAGYSVAGFTREGCYVLVTDQP